jgi:hypothetical protein
MSIFAAKLAAEEYGRTSQAEAELSDIENHKQKQHYERSRENNSLRQGIHEGEEQNAGGTGSSEVVQGTQLPQGTDTKGRRGTASANGNGEASDTGNGDIHPVDVSRKPETAAAPAG